jgi:hypothetical protein
MLRWVFSAGGAVGTARGKTTERSQEAPAAQQDTILALENEPKSHGARCGEWLPGWRRARSAQRLTEEPSVHSPAWRIWRDGSEVEENRRLNSKILRPPYKNCFRKGLYFWSDFTVCSRTQLRTRSISWIPRANFPAPEFLLSKPMAFINWRCSAWCARSSG